MSANTVVLLPVRGFGDAKTRLRQAVAAARREELARTWADGVRAAAGHLPVAVMTDDPEVADWAASTGADTIGDAGPDLNGSADAAVATLWERGASRVIVAHADLPLADDLAWLERLAGVVIVPDRRADGTNVLAVPAGAGFRFHYGPASSHHHEAEAQRLGLTATVVRDPLLAWDVDVAEDLAVPQGNEVERLQQASLRAREAVTPGAARAITAEGNGRQ